MDEPTVTGYAGEFFDTLSGKDLDTEGVHKVRDAEIGTIAMMGVWQVVGRLIGVRSLEYVLGRRS